MKAIRTRYVGPSNTKGSRIIADDGDGNRATVGYEHALNSEGNHRLAAEALMAKMGWSGHLTVGWWKSDGYWTFSD